jgi:hypothetical protein
LVVEEAVAQEIMEVGQLVLVVVALVEILAMVATMVSLELVVVLVVQASLQQVEALVDQVL